jgi:hypothetical protein
VPSFPRSHQQNGVRHSEASDALEQRSRRQQCATNLHALLMFVSQRLLDALQVLTPADVQTPPRAVSDARSCTHTVVCSHDKTMKH